MGCAHSKKKTCERGRRKNAKQASSTGCEKHSLDDLCPESKGQLEQYECQVKVLHDFLAAPGSLERDDLLKTHQHNELCVLVHSIAEKVKLEMTAELKALHEQDLKSTTEEYEGQVQELLRIHKEEKATLDEVHRATENNLKETVEELTADLKFFTELKQRVEMSTLKRDLQRNIETHGTPGAFWEQEQESLLFVIEMKRERVQELGSKLLQMEALVQKNLSLEDQVIHLLQQNEDLSVRIENYQSLIQQLSKEQSDLQEALEMQSELVQKLGHEKDELRFKLLQRGDSCAAASFLLPPVLPEVSPS
ncbi:coiled-coil domain-containing protein 69 [Denticeps clupeoides]|uniref:Coiled-coil domain-containing protein 69 n=1 Tax=Denticeps clupeoides TaxID=299321 RepID=A0AAY4EME7_9TELE|nr:coiled-coil domain-containing protein 69 [Denticeps clupeoides]